MTLVLIWNVLVPTVTEPSGVPALSVLLYRGAGPVPSTGLTLMSLKFVGNVKAGLPVAVLYTAAAPAHEETSMADESSRKVPFQLKVAPARAGLAGTVKGRADRKYWLAVVLPTVV